jgi:hypothetical protein
MSTIVSFVWIAVLVGFFRIVCSVGIQKMCLLSMIGQFIRPRPTGLLALRSVLYVDGKVTVVSPELRGVNLKRYHLLDLRAAHGVSDRPHCCREHLQPLPTRKWLGKKGIKLSNSCQTDVPYIYIHIFPHVHGLFQQELIPGFQEGCPSF